MIQLKKPNGMLVGVTSLVTPKPKTVKVDRETINGTVILKTNGIERAKVKIHGTVITNGKEIEVERVMTGTEKEMTGTVITNGKEIEVERVMIGTVITNGKEIEVEKEMIGTVIINGKEIEVERVMTGTEKEMTGIETMIGTEKEMVGVEMDYERNLIIYETYLLNLCLFSIILILPFNLIYYGNFRIKSLATRLHYHKL